MHGGELALEVPSDALEIVWPVTVACHVRL
jgi:hypothetical protein